MTSLLESALLLPAEALLNALLSRDVFAAQRLGKLAGRTIEIESRLPDWFVSVRILERGIQLSSSSNGKPDARLRGSSRELVSLLLESATGGGLSGGAIEIHGDAELVQDVYRLLSALEVDWQGPLSALFGDRFTQGVDDLSGTAMKWSIATSRQAISNIDEYLHEEGRWLPSTAETEGFSLRLDDLRLRIDRLAARVSQLKPRGSDK
ncbi:MAG: hypothetical protein RLZZ385_2529 [Pseudomonadota bacterium]|jgi:ubiquinone biosynthesis protein UbiJ